MHFCLRYIQFIVILVLLIPNCYGKQFGEVRCGAYPIHIYDFDFKNDSFKITFYAWCLSKTGYELGKNVEIANATEYKVHFSENTKVQGLDRNNCRYTATVVKHWDLTNFPFDRQILKVVIEDGVNPEKDIKFIPDTKNSNIDEKFYIPGWTINDYHVTTATHEYKSNFGDESITGSTYSDLVLVFDIKRHGLQLFIDKFMGYFIAFFLCLMAYFAPLDNVNFRGSLMLGSVFATVSNKYVIDQVIPPYSNPFLAEIIHRATIFVIFYTFTSIIVSNHIYKDSRNKAAIFVNRFSIAFCLIVYIGVISIFTIKAVLS